MKVSLIGMSGSGKTYWSKKLQQQGFRRICCDDLIEEKLEKELQHLGYSGLRDVAKWMGQPFDSRYEETSRKYLAFEAEVVAEALAYSMADTSDEPVILDTTGSVIYIHEKILQLLAASTTVLYLETPLSVQQKMYQLYRSDPKPVIWGHSFVNKHNRTQEESLAECYPDLLAYISREYEKLAQVIFDYDLVHSSGFTIEMFMASIESQLVCTSPVLNPAL